MLRDGPVTYVSQLHFNLQRKMWVVTLYASKKKQCGISVNIELHPDVQRLYLLESYVVTYPR